MEASSTIFGSLLALAAVLLPPLVAWFLKKVEGPTYVSPVIDLRRRHEKVLSRLGRAVKSSDPVGIATAFAIHDRMLQIDGIVGGSGPDSSVRGGSTDNGRANRGNLHSN